MLESGPRGPGPGARRGEGARRRRDPRERDLGALRAVPDLDASGRRASTARTRARIGATFAMLDSLVAGAQARGHAGAADADRADPGLGLALQGLGRHARASASPTRSCSAQFVRALGTRYPTVKLWSIWNEPNLALVAAAAVRGRRARVAVQQSASLYRALAASAIAGLRATGHRDDRPDLARRDRAARRRSRPAARAQRSLRVPDALREPDPQDLAGDRSCAACSA